MTFNPRHFASIVITSTLAVSCYSAPMGKADYADQKNRINDNYKAEKVACGSFSGNTKDVCLAKAESKENIALATLEYSYTGKRSDANKLAVVKADSDFAVAKEMCGDKAGDSKDMCMTEAKSAHVKALADAKMTRKVGDARKDAVDDNRDADFKVAIAKCNQLAGMAQDACVTNAKSQFGKN